MNEEAFKNRQVIRRAKGEFFFKQNELSQELFIMKKGTVRVFKTEGNIDIDLDIVGQGGIFGEIAAIDRGARSASVIATEDAEAYVIPAEEFKKISRKIPDWFQKIATILVHRLREVDGKIDRNMNGAMTTHVAAALTLIAFSENCRIVEGKQEINQKFLENELMDMLSMKLSDVTESLNILAKQLLISIDKGRIIILNKEKLEELGQTVFAALAESPVT
jgi:cAMP-binding proteins - catabolite gene activator and regulatory subunit of cAMP-dependent protein kinases